MSDEEKKIVEAKKPITNEKAAEWWRRGKKLVIFWEAIRTVVLIGGIIWGVGLAIENRIAEVLATPRRVTIVENKVDSGFKSIDSLTIRHNFYTIFQYLDTTNQYSEPIIFRGK